MKVVYIVALLAIVFMIGCATTTPETPPAVPETPSAVPETPPEPLETPDVGAGVEGEGGMEAPVEVGADIQILNRAFDPDNLEVAAGSAVTWKNMDDLAVHSLSIVGDGVICSRKQTGEICEYTFDEPGTYEVMDLINKFRGTIIVTGGAAAESETE